MPKQAQMALVAQVNQFTKATWCTVEYQVIFDLSAPPTVMMITACRLDKAFQMTTPAINSVWKQYVLPEHGVIVVIHHTGTRAECLVEANKLSLSKRPICIMGANQSISRPMIQCDDGRTWRTQVEAAEALGTTQSAVSMALRGLSATVAGHRLAYVENGQ